MWWWHTSPHHLLELFLSSPSAAGLGQGHQLYLLYHRPFGWLSLSKEHNVIQLYSHICESTILGYVCPVAADSSVMLLKKALPVYFLSTYIRPSNEVLRMSWMHSELAENPSLEYKMPLRLDQV